MYKTGFYLTEARQEVRTFQALVKKEGGPGRWLECLVS